MTKKEEVFELLQQHPEGLDDDDIKLMTGIQSRQQVQQVCNHLASAHRIRRQSVEKEGKRRKIHNFPLLSPGTGSHSGKLGGSSELWHRRLSALVAATGRHEADLLDEALHLLALRILQGSSDTWKPNQ